MLTKSGVSGATIAPNLATIEHEFMIVVRMHVGHISAVNVYIDVKAHIIDAFPSIKNINEMLE